MAPLLEMARNKRKDESGFTLIDLMVGIIITGILTAMASTIFFSFIKTESAKKITQELPVVGKEVETAFAKYPNATTIDSDAVINIPESFKNLHIVFAGTSSDYCVISTMDYDGNRRLEQGDTSSEVSKDTPYFVYYGSTRTLTEMTDISGLSCVKSGVSLLK